MRRLECSMKLETVGAWSEQKLEILGKYVRAYNTVLEAQRRKGLSFHRVYIDAFAGAGEHISRSTGDRIAGSPLEALSVSPPFEEYHFIELRTDRADHLRSLVETRPNVYFYQGDCNRVPCETVFPRVQFDEYRRAFCFLDPFGLHLKWEVFRKAAEMRTIEILLNFSIMDLNMNCGRRDPESISPDQAARLTAFWGDDSWRETVYTTDGVQRNLFGTPEKAPNEAIVQGFCDRLRETAGFAFVAEPVPMKNSKGATVYYLVFAGPNETGAKIANSIFAAYRNP